MAKRKDKKKKKKKEPINWFHGEHLCHTIGCKWKAYYLQQGQPRCGRHSDRGIRKGLPKNPELKEIKKEEIDRMHRECVESMEENRSIGIHGNVDCDLGTNWKIPYRRGFHRVFPNHAAKQRVNDPTCIAVPELSPMKLGPIDHGQPGLPPSQCLENFHQGNKVFLFETDKDGRIRQRFFDKQLEMYNDKEGHRHKFDRKDIPNDSVFVFPDGTIRHYQYVQSRYFYCHWYELLAKERLEFRALKKMVEEGCNLLIIGYDGRPIDGDLYDMYLNDEYPFGHELALCCLLKFDDPKDYPWNRYHEEHRDIYPF